MAMTERTQQADELEMFANGLGASARANTKPFTIIHGIEAALELETALRAGAAALRSSLPSGEKELGGHESHGGRGDLGPAARPELSHDGDSK